MQPEEENKSEESVKETEDSYVSQGAPVFSFQRPLWNTFIREDEMEQLPLYEFMTTDVARSPDSVNPLDSLFGQESSIARVCAEDPQLGNYLSRLQHMPLRTYFNLVDKAYEDGPVFRMERWAGPVPAKTIDGLRKALFLLEPPYPTNEVRFQQCHSRAEQLELLRGKMRIGAQVFMRLFEHLEDLTFSSIFDKGNLKSSQEIYDGIVGSALCGSTPEESWKLFPRETRRQVRYYADKVVKQVEEIGSFAEKHRISQNIGNQESEDSISVSFVNELFDLRLPKDETVSTFFSPFGIYIGLP